METDPPKCGKITGKPAEDELAFSPGKGLVHFLQQGDESIRLCGVVFFFYRKKLRIICFTHITVKAYSQGKKTIFPYRFYAAMGSGDYHSEAFLSFIVFIDEISIRLIAPQLFCIGL